MEVSILRPIKAVEAIVGIGKPSLLLLRSCARVLGLDGGCHIEGHLHSAQQASPYLLEISTLRCLAHKDYLH